MHAEATPLPGVLVLRPPIFRDARGHFLETWQAARYEAAGVPGPFVQDNLSRSARGVLRGLHGQAPPHAQGKLVTVVHGRAYDVVVDARPGSPHFGQWLGVTLDAAEGTQLWVPAGFLHGFQALEPDTILSYKCTAPYHQAAEFSVAWNDPALGISWPIFPPLVSNKDADAPPLAAIDHSRFVPWSHGAA